MLTADESLKDIKAAKNLAAHPQPFGIYNIKLMKCGGIHAARKIAAVAEQHHIYLFWGCNDESILSITAALHAAYSCTTTKYLDLDGSFDLAEDLVTGGFVLKDGILSISDAPGLGCTWLKN
jgi:L-alanine-DL-glutamate epimerase-like enolase superfamily enzyme